MVQSFRLTLRRAILASGFLLLLVYQNCAQAPQTNSSNSASSYVQALPFAYEFKSDTLAYMSCSDITTTANRRAYFSFRMGAYSTYQEDTPYLASTRGLTLTSAFRTATAYYTATDRAQVLSESARNGNTNLSLSIRDRSQLQSIWSVGSSSAQGDDINSLLPVSLDSAEIAGPLAAGPANYYRSYFPSADAQRLTEGSLNFYSAESGVADATRSTLEGNAILVLGYTGSATGTDTSLRGPNDFDSTSGVSLGSTSNTNVYGKGYKVAFAYANGQSSGIRRVLSSSGVQEIDLTTGQTVTSGWTCPTTNQFLIVRPEDIVSGLASCARTVDPSLASLTTAQQNALIAIRRVLRVEDWYVDVINHCVSPRRTSDTCYGANLGTRTIQYYSASCTWDNTHACPHFVSVCTNN